MIYELTPNDSRKSFYGKAHIETEGNIEYLISYNTLVIVKENGIIYRTTDYEIYCDCRGWSATTGRHIKAYCGLNKAEYLKLPIR